MTTDTEYKPPRSSHPKRLGEFMPGLTAPVLGKKAGLFAKLVAAWADVAGPEIAAVALPVDLKFKKVKDKTAASQAVLILGVNSTAQALELSYQKALLTERLNMFFGYKAVTDIHIVQDDSIMNNNLTTAPKLLPVSRQNLEKIEEMTASIEEKDLQTALKNLGKAILSRREPSRKE
jgi:hypothetical protein